MKFPPENGIILREEVLDEGYIPENISFRTTQIEELKFCLEPSLKCARPFNAWLYGASGTGKTLIAKYVLRKLTEETSVWGIYLNCSTHRTFHSLLTQIIAKLKIFGGEERDVGRKQEAIQQHFGSKPFVVILDELQRVNPRERENILYNFYYLGNVGLICIGGKSRFPLFSLSEAIHSRLGIQLIQFSPYTVQELIEILKERAEASLLPESWTTKILEKIAQLARGDARMAIQILRKASKLAEKNADDFIKEKYIIQSYPKIKELKKTYLLTGLTPHHKLLYNLIKKHKQIFSSKLWQIYLKECQKRNWIPIASRTFPNYYKELLLRELIESPPVKARGRTKLLKAVDL